MNWRNLQNIIKDSENKLFNFIRRFIPDRDDALDILQDVFYQLIAGFDHIENQDAVSSWLYKVARNKVTDFYRKKKPQRLPENTESLFEILPDLSDAPDKDLLKDEMWETINRCLDAMPEKQREVLILHEFEEKSFKEIAEITGENSNKLLSRKRYALQFLKKEIEKIYQDL